MPKKYGLNQQPYQPPYVRPLSPHEVEKDVSTENNIPQISWPTQTKQLGPMSFLPKSFFSSLQEAKKDFSPLVANKTSGHIPSENNTQQIPRNAWSTQTKQLGPMGFLPKSFLQFEEDVILPPAFVRLTSGNRVSTVSNIDISFPGMVTLPPGFGDNRGDLSPLRQPSLALAAPKKNVSLWRNFDFCLILAGQTISGMGDMCYNVALPSLVLNSKGNAQDLGLVLTAYGVPRLLTILIGGALSDRWSPRNVMLFADVIRVVLVGMLFFLTVSGKLSLGYLYAISIPLGALQGFFLPASFSILPKIVSEHQLQSANALNETFTQVANFAGTGIAGLIVASLPVGNAVLVDALSFVVSAITLACMSNGKYRIPDEQKDQYTEMQTQPLEISKIEQDDSRGQESILHLLRNSRLFQGIIVVTIFGNLSTGSIEVGLPFLARNVLTIGANGYGFILSFLGGGAIVGALVAGYLNKLTRRGLMGLLFALGQAVATALIPLGASLFIACTAVGMIGICQGVINVLFVTIVGQKLPRHLLGSIMAILIFCSFSSYPLSVFVAGIGVERFGPVVIFLVSGLILAIAALLGLSLKALRTA